MRKLVKVSLSLRVAEKVAVHVHGELVLAEKQVYGKYKTDDYVRYGGGD